MADCGTLAGYMAHRKADEPIDDECQAANTAYHRQYRIASGDGSKIRNDLECTWTRAEVAEARGGL